jgi:hypothetical protein
MAYGKLKVDQIETSTRVVDIDDLAQVSDVPVQSVAGKTGAVSLVKGDVGLGNVDNTSDANKPISTATQAALNLKADQTALAAKADLVDGKLATAQIPDLALSTFLGAVASEAELLALSGQRGDWAVRTDANQTFILIADDASAIGNWREVLTPADTKAPLASPALTGVPTAPTAAAGTNTTQIATTAFVTTALSGAGAEVGDVVTTARNLQAPQHLPLDGSTYSQSAYPELFAVLGQQNTSPVPGTPVALNANLQGTAGESYNNSSRRFASSIDSDGTPYLVTFNPGGRTVHVGTSSTNGAFPDTWTTSTLPSTVDTAAYRIYASGDIIVGIFSVSGYSNVEAYSDTAGNQVVISSDRGASWSVVDLSGDSATYSSLIGAKLNVAIQGTTIIITGRTKYDSPGLPGYFVSEDSGAAFDYVTTTGYSVVDVIYSQHRNGFIALRHINNGSASRYGLARIYKNAGAWIIEAYSSDIGNNVQTSDPTQAILAEINNSIYVVLGTTYQSLRVASTANLNSIGSNLTSLSLSFQNFPGYFVSSGSTIIYYSSWDTAVISTDDGLTFATVDLTAIGLNTFNRLATIKLTSSNSYIIQNKYLGNDYSFYAYDGTNNPPLAFTIPPSSYPKTVVESPLAAAIGETIVIVGRFRSTFDGATGEYLYNVSTNGGVTFELGSFPLSHAKGMSDEVRIYSYNNNFYIAFVEFDRAYVYKSADGQAWQLMKQIPFSVGSNNYSWLWNPALPKYMSHTPSGEFVFFAFVTGNDNKRKVFTAVYSQETDMLTSNVFDPSTLDSSINGVRFVGHDSTTNKFALIAESIDWETYVFTTQVFVQASGSPTSPTFSSSLTTTTDPLGVLGIANGAFLYSLVDPNTNQAVDVRTINLASATTNTVLVGAFSNVPAGATFYGGVNFSGAYFQGSLQFSILFDNLARVARSSDSGASWTIVDADGGISNNDWRVVGNKLVDLNTFSNVYSMNLPRTSVAVYAETGGYDPATQFKVPTMPASPLVNYIKAS